MAPVAAPVHMAAVGLLQGDRGVLMVESRYPTVLEPFWALPGGMLEPGEGITQALSREIFEEANIQIIEPVSVVAVIWLRPSTGDQAWVTFVCESRAWSGEPSAENDPDGVTIDAAFVPLSEAIPRLSALPWGISHAIVERLQGAPVGGIWEYRWPGDNPFDGKGPAELMRHQLDEPL